MKQLLLICALVVGQSVLAADKKPLTKDESVKVIEAAIRKAAKKPTGELTKADYEKVKVVRLSDKQLTDVKGLEKLTKLRSLDLSNNKLTEVPKELEKCTQLTHLNLQVNQLTNVKGLEKLKRLKKLHIYNNPALTKAQIAELQKALLKCRISSNPKK
jgi:Leucine-rich repeat (LRR) protein